MTSELSRTERTQHRRLREQGRTERSELLAVLAAGLVAHLGVINDGWPMVVPTRSPGGPGCAPSYRLSFLACVRAVAAWAPARCRSRTGERSARSPVGCGSAAGPFRR
jgi:hypothetical protein